LADVTNEVRLGLPGGGFMVQQADATTNVITIWMLWQEQEAAGSDAADSSALGACPNGITGSSVRCLPMKVAL
ncbi:MAG: hypothetical protein M3O62_06040, partial [Pseudomonadota bacterium]|nr:hypothetical protein [Pseudomonadota bacterium]